MCVVIPVSDNPRTISRVTRDVVNETPYPVLLIDDASEHPVSSSLYSFEVREAMAAGRVRVERFAKRRGPGAALAFAIYKLAAEGFTHMLTLEADGRHPAREIAKLAAEAERHPWDLILGSPPPPAAGGWRHRIRQALESRVRLERGARVRDPRGGFRAYPLFPLQTLKFRSRSRDFNLEVLIRALWNKVRVREVDVDVIEPEPADRAPAPNPWLTRARVAALNLVLMTVALLRTRSRPGELGLAFGLGIFVGCTPLIGVHAGVAVALAFAFRLNVVAVVLGSRISTPLLVPPLVVASLFIGHHWLHVPAGAGLMGHVYRWAAGSIVLGLILGVIGGVAAYLFASLGARPPRDEPGGRRFLGWLKDRGGARAVRAWAWVVALCWLALSPRARRGFGQFHAAVGSWRRWRHARALLERRADWWSAPPARLAPGSPALGLGVTVWTGPVGDWETGARGAGLDFVPVVDPARPSAAPSYELFVFLGRLAPFDVAGVRAAAEAGRPLQTAFAFKTDDAYALEFGSPRVIKGLTADEIYADVGGFVGELERRVRARPEDWALARPFWSEIPER